MNTRTRRFAAIAAAFALLLILPTLLFAQTPNLSGTWKMDAQRSQMPQAGAPPGGSGGGAGGRGGRGGGARPGGGGGMFPQQMVIKQEGTTITLSWSQQMGRSDSQEITETFTTDGKLSKNESALGSSTITAEWKNSMLIVKQDTERDFQGQTRTQTTTTTYTLSPDGTSLLRFVDMGMRGGQLVSANIVYTKVK